MKENKVLTDTYNGKKLINPLTIHEKIHACRNHCIQYCNKEYDDLDRYPNCGASWYQKTENY